MRLQHEGDPDGLLLGPNYGVLRTGNKLLKRLLAKGLGRYLDGILTHTYYITLEAKQGLPNDVRELVAMARKHLRPGAKIMNTEWGVRWKRPPNEDPDALRTETAKFMRGHLITLGEGVDATFFFYTGDHGTRGAGLLYNLSLATRRFGATHVAPKPVFMAAATATRLLEGTTSLGAIEYLGAGVLGYAFDRNGERIVCLWSEDERPRTVKFPTGNAATVTSVDPMGNSREVACQSGAIDVALTSIPTWLRRVDPAVLPLGGARRPDAVLKAFAGEQVDPDVLG